MLNLGALRKMQPAKELRTLKEIAEDANLKFTAEEFILQSLKFNPGTRIDEVVRITGLAKSTVALKVGGLKERGLITSKLDSHGNGNSKAAYLTLVA